MLIGVEAIKHSLTSRHIRVDQPARQEVQFMANNIHNFILQSPRIIRSPLRLCRLASAQIAIVCILLLGSYRGQSPETYPLAIVRDCSVFSLQNQLLWYSAHNASGSLRNVLSPMRATSSHFTTRNQGQLNESGVMRIRYVWLQRVFQDLSRALRSCSGLPSTLHSNMLNSITSHARNNCVVRNTFMKESSFRECAGKTGEVIPYPDRIQCDLWL